MRLISYYELRPLKGIIYTRPGISKLIRAGKFPKPIQISPKRIAWLEEEIDAHIAGLVKQREAA
jgi:prophage regulatory protein